MFKINYKVVYLSDVESYNTWLEFEIVDNSILINEVKSLKENGSKDLEYHLENFIKKEWNNPKVKYKEFRSEITAKLNDYRNFIIKNNTNTSMVKELAEKLKP